MRWIRRVVWLAGAAVVLAGCGAAGFATQPGAPNGGVAGCSDAQVENGNRVLSCAEAVTAAETSLGWLHTPISQATFTRTDWGPPCPANARCVAQVPISGVVAFEFWFGDPVLMSVAIDESGDVIATPMEDPDAVEEPHDGSGTGP